MDLFQTENNERILNLLPCDGVVNYLGKVVDKRDADFYFDRLLHTIEWKNDEAVLFGKHFITKRKIAWYGDAAYCYTYSNITRQALLWTPELSLLKKLAEEHTNITFNACLLNLYHNGQEGMGWHSDDESELEKNACIASFSFGAERKFSFRHKRTKQTASVILEHGSLLLMKDDTQVNWLHSLPKSKKILKPRINLTFRRMSKPEA
jgi:alkylated DNA repair dioxygenase AlkB